MHAEHEGRKQIVVTTCKSVSRLWVCKHTTTDEIAVTLAYALDLPTWKIAMLNRGSIIPRKAQAVDVTQGSYHWIATTYPLSSRPC